MSGSEQDNLNYASDHRDEPQGGEPDGPPWKPTRAGPGFIIALIAMCALLLTLFLMFILRIF